MPQKSSDYFAMLAILSVMIAAGEYYFPRRSSPDEMKVFKNLYDPL